MKQLTSSSLVCLLLMFQAHKMVHSIPSQRICLEYDTGGTDIKNNGTVKRTSCEKSQDKCFISWKQEMKDGKERVKILKKGCWNYEDNENEACGSSLCISTERRSDNIEFCCCKKDLCNKDFLSMTENLITEKNKPTSTGSEDTAEEENMQVLTVIIYAAIVFLVLTSALVIVFIMWKRKIMRKETVHGSHITAGSFSSDFPPIRLIRPITRGKFGEIWQGMLNSKLVAVKKFHRTQKFSWDNEKEIFSLGLEHNGILKYYGATPYPEKDTISFILIFEYHARGSLRNFLRFTTLSWQEMCQMSHSIAEALAYLHGELVTAKNLPCIVHRDVTSENILVKEDGSCVLCDLGLSRALPDDQDNGYKISQENQQVGSLRYMAPEALEGHINLNDVTSQLKQIDIYALGIVLWEISSRCDEICEGDLVPTFRLPFEELITELTLQNLKNCILIQKVRPSFPNVWKTDEQGIQRLQELISECWDQDPEARLSASCISHRVIQLKHHKLQTSV